MFLFFQFWKEAGFEKIVLLLVSNHILEVVYDLIVLSRDCHLVFQRETVGTHCTTVQLLDPVRGGVASILCTSMVATCQ